MDIFERQEIEPKEQQEMRESYQSYDRYGGFYYFGPKKLVMPKEFKDLGPILKNLEVRNDDIWIGGFSRSGTHWLAELTWLLGNNLDFEKSHKIHHEERILYYDFHEEVVKNDANNKLYMDLEVAQTIYTALPSPRYLKTHLPLSYLPAKLLDTAKMVYIARDPRDVLVSCFNFYSKHLRVGFKGDLKSMWNQFKTGHFFYGPYFDNVLEFWKQRDHKNLLFLFYEEMHEDLLGSIKRIAQFFGCQYSEDQLHSLCEHLNFNNMKNHKNLNYDKLLGSDSQQVVRKGKAGGWREEFDEEMTRDAEAWISEKLKGTDFKYPHQKTVL